MMTPPMILRGSEAIAYAEQHGKKLNKYADPTQGARMGVTIERAREIVQEDPGLIWIEDLHTESRYLVVSRAPGNRVGAYATFPVSANAVRLMQLWESRMEGSGIEHIMPIAQVNHPHRKETKMTQTTIQQPTAFEPDVVALVNGMAQLWRTGGL